MYFAARDSNTLVPSDPEIDRYFDRWTKATSAEPVLHGRLPQRYRGSLANSALIYTTNPAVIDAWSAGHIKTGDYAFDALINSLGAISLGPWRDRGDGSYYFRVITETVFNEELLHDSLVMMQSWLDDAIERPQDDGSFRWNEGEGAAGLDTSTAEIEFRFGWGDCFVACLGFRTLRAIVPPGESPAIVYDLGGDPLPPYIELSPNTQPFPP